MVFFCVDGVMIISVGGRDAIRYGRGVFLTQRHCVVFVEGFERAG